MQVKLGTGLLTSVKLCRPPVHRRRDESTSAGCCLLATRRGKCGGCPPSFSEHHLPLSGSEDDSNGLSVVTLRAMLAHVSTAKAGQGVMLGAACVTDYFQDVCICNGWYFSMFVYDSSAGDTVPCRYLNELAQGSGRRTRPHQGPDPAACASVMRPWNG